MYFWLGVAAFFFIIYLILNRYKSSKVNKFISEAFEAIKQGQDGSAASLFKEALLYANENPDQELKIVAELKALYDNHGIKYSFENFESLVEQSRILIAKSSNKALKELGKVIELKNKIIDKMPDLDDPTPHL